MADQDKEIHWIEVKIKSSGELAEALSEVIGRFAPNGVVVESIMRFNQHTQEHEPTGEIAVSGYLPADSHLEEQRQKLEEALWHLRQIAPIPTPEYLPIRDLDWMAAWKKNYHPVPIGDNLLILPAWKDPDPDETRVVIRINPALAFGTGTHPSTQLCLRLLNAHLTPGNDVIDVGCGSGILSIAALKLGAKHCLAIDIDSQAILSTLKNAALNEIDESTLETGKGSVEEVQTGRFTLKNAPLVMANILAPIIIHLLGLGLADLVTPGGTLLLSGILDHQAEELLQVAEKAGFTLIDRLTDADWVSLAVVKQSSLKTTEP